MDQTGKLVAVRTPGGLPRYEADVVDELLADAIQSMEKPSLPEPSAGGSTAPRHG